MPLTNRQIRLRARNAHKNNTKRVTRGNGQRSAASAHSVNNYHAQPLPRRAASVRNRRNCVGKNCSSRRLGAAATVMAGFAGIGAKKHFNRANNTVRHTHTFGPGPSNKYNKYNFNNSPKKYRTGKVPSNYKPMTYNRNAANTYKRAANAHQSRRKGEKLKTDVLGKQARRPTALHLAGRTK